MRGAADQLHQLIEELTIDCHNEGEQLTGFLTAIIEEELTSPIAATVVGAPVELLAIATTARPAPWTHRPLPPWRDDVRRLRA